MTVQTVNPATGEPIASYEHSSSAGIEGLLSQSWSGFRALAATTMAERGALLRRLVEALSERHQTYAQLISQEMGKPLSEASAEITKCARACDFYAAHGQDFLAAKQTPSNATRSYVQFSPLGPVLAIMPWNFPFWQVIRAAAPIVMAGNSVVLKHASNVTGCALELESLFHQAGFPQGTLRTVVLPGAAVMPLIADDRIRAVTLTGSEAVGAEVAAAAGLALKKTVLELGGSDPFIVLADADLEICVATAVKARFQNAGQSCIAAKRFIVEAAVAEEFEARFAAAAAQLVVGDPLDPRTDMGPVARDDLRATLIDQVTRSLGLGARIVTGGKPGTGRGFFFEPTVVADVTPEMPLFREETFGPVAPITVAADAAEAFRLANSSDFGLGASLWTEDVERASQLSPGIGAGCVFINGMTVSDPRLPFGGIKRSGYGRELGEFGIREFTNIQTVWIGPQAAANDQDQQIIEALEPDDHDRVSARATS